ncbi:oxidation resistance protein 1-like isoform X3 [Dreissena polymorpha]|uniref:oxidation resistance protein 1-like isoform X3 n=1 Tax=Dreissena polymorpha TaxID=45954 RepID=UPI002264F52F|nr:oxidation resistance protein 1-like isoform X3 [Dreissena polymorpha]
MAVSDPNKKGSWSARTLEKLGLTTWTRMRSNSQPKSDEPNQPKSELEKSKNTDSVPTITAGQLDLSDKDPKKSIKGKIGGTKPVEKSRSKKLTKWTSGFRSKKAEQSNSQFYLDDPDADLVTKATGSNGGMQEKRNKSQPDGTIQYIVEVQDTLEKIAAHFDTTPSELKKLNKLFSSTIFPGQVLFIRDKDFQPQSQSVSSNEESGNASQSDSVFGSPDNKPKMDVPLVKASNTSPTKVPGHAHRQTPVNSPKTFDIEEVMPPHKLTEDEVQQLDQDCMERFIKLQVKHITDGQGVVKGTLLVTPNAVMFDPDVSDPLVVEHGTEKYGMIAPMDMIISAAMYHDIAAMKMRGKKMEDGSTFQPEVYHDMSCPLAKEKLHASQVSEQSKYSSMTPDNIKTILQNPLSRADSVCSCGHGARNDDLVFEADDIIDGKVGNDQEDESVHGIVPEEGRQDDVKEVDRDTDDMSAIYTENRAENTDVFGLGLECDNMEKDFVAAAKASPRSGKGQKKLSVSFSIPESDDITASIKKLEGDLELTKINECQFKETEKDLIDFEVWSKNLGTGIAEESSPNGETRIGSIVYLPMMEDRTGQVTVQSVEKTQETLSKLSVDEFSVISKSDSDISSAVGENAKTDNKDIEKVRSPSTSSLGQFSPTPHLNAFVNYASGFFQRHASDSSIKDLKDVIMDTFSDSKQSPESKTETEGRLKDSTSVARSDIPSISAAPMGRRRGKLSRHGDVAVESAVPKDEKSELFSTDYSKFVTKAASYHDPPLYLCLRLGNPQNKNVLPHNYTIESYGRRKKRSEYWFSIPREKVDHLYAFFVQWTPEIYGDEEEITPEKRGFVVINDKDIDSEDINLLDSSFQKDWEFICKKEMNEIISQSEALKRRSIVFEEPIPLPELIGDTKILTEAYVEQLSQVMPGRTIGYNWTLIYSTDKHGFSLHTLYRFMAGLDSPILLIVKDTNNVVFGALTSCELKHSEAFYGTGETYLFTFHPDFRVFNWTGENNFFIKGNQDSLSIGASQGQFGLWFDEDLYHGRTNCCETFDNDILTLAEDFVVKEFEAWAFISD